MKLYWRYKKHGKWTWRPIEMSDQLDKETISRLVEAYQLEEEE